MTEDGVPAQIFVGENIAYQTQSIVNDQGVILTSNFEYLDVGVSLKVTPYLGSSDIIALEIENEITSVITAAQAGVPANSNVGPTPVKALLSLVSISPMASSWSSAECCAMKPTVLMPMHHA